MVVKKPWEQKVPLHNCWHPHIPPVADKTEGEVFRDKLVDYNRGSIGHHETSMNISNTPR